MPNAHRPLTAVDAAWLRMDRPENAMVITSLLAFDEALPFDAIAKLVRDRLLGIDRFCEHVVRPAIGRPRWERDPRFDLGAHLDRLALPAPGGDVELTAALEGIAAQPLDPARPLWRLHVVEGYRGGTALVMRVHHCIGDGVALVMMLLGMTDEGRYLRPPAVGLSEPTVASLAGRARRAAAQAVTLARLLLLPPDPPSPLRGPLGLRKHHALTPAIPLETVKRIARSHGVTVNDVAVAAIAGALRRHMESHRAPPPAIRALLPMYLRGHEDDDDLGNHFGLVYVDLPLDVADPVERLAVAHQRTTAIKTSPEATVALEVLGAIGIAPKVVEDLSIRLFTAKASAMITNVAGPPDRLHLDGHAVTTMAVWAPVSGCIGLGLSVLTYAGELRLGVVSDAGLIPDPARLAASFVDQIVALDARTTAQAMRDPARAAAVATSSHP